MAGGHGRRGPEHVMRCRAGCPITHPSTARHVCMSAGFVLYSSVVRDPSNLWRLSLLPSSVRWWSSSAALKEGWWKSRRQNEVLKINDSAMFHRVFIPSDLLWWNHFLVTRSFRGETPFAFRKDISVDGSESGTARFRLVQHWLTGCYGRYVLMFYRTRTPPSVLHWIQFLEASSVDEVSRDGRGSLLPHLDTVNQH